MCAATQQVCNRCALHLWQLGNCRRITRKDTLVERTAGSAAAAPNKSARERAIDRIGMVAQILHRTEASAIQTAKSMQLRERRRAEGGKQVKPNKKKGRRQKVQT